MIEPRFTVAQPVTDEELAVLVAVLSRPGAPVAPSYHASETPGWAASALPRGPRRGRPGGWAWSASAGWRAG